MTTEEKQKLYEWMSDELADHEVQEFLYWATVNRDRFNRILSLVTEWKQTTTDEILED